MKAVKRLAALSAALVTMSAVLPYVPEGQGTVSAAGKVLAFPGAVGGGKYATGGRGGEVYHVTNLNDSGEGSFRDAVSQSGRIVVFDVSGTIELEGNILCHDNITIAGQTAPGGSGITLKNYKMGMSGDNIICRYISSRPGPYASTSSGNDAWGGAKGSGSIIDHCSMGWTTDEQWGLYSNNKNYTVQYCIIGPADSWGGHKKGLHGFGIMMGNGSLSFDHNLIIHNVSRNFRGKVPGTEVADFTNNVIYDWGYQTAYGTIGHLNYVNNTLKAGKSTTGGYHWMYVDSTTSPQNFKVYCSGNRMINKDGSLNQITFDNWSGVTVKDSIGITKDNLYSAQPFPITQYGENISSVQGAESAEAAFDHVVSFAGNGIAPDKRTAIDQQCAADAKNGTGSCSGTAAYDGSVTDLNKYSIQCGVSYTYPSAVTKKEITDNDNDGMEDSWELARGLDPNDPTDYKGDYCGKGYNNIEYYINDLTVDSFPEGVVELSPEGTFPDIPHDDPSVSGKLIKELNVNSSAHPMGWEISETVKAGSPVFGDRSFVFTSFPQELEGAEQLLTACDAKGETGDTATFTAGADMELYIGLDTRLEKIPDWLNDYTKTSLTASTDNDVTFELYSRKCSAGDRITLGGNGQSGYCVNYIVLASALAQPATDPPTEPPTEPETVPPTEPPTEEETAAPVYGDANDDGMVNVADAVAVLQYTANQTKYPMTEYQQLCADIDGAPGITGMDAIIIQKVDAGLINRADLPLKN